MNDNILSGSLADVVTDSKKIQFNIPNNIEKSLKIFEKNLSTASITQKEWLKSMYGSEFIKLKYTLSYLPLLRSIQDKIYTKHLKYDKHIPTNITNSFENLIKGFNS